MADVQKPQRIQFAVQIAFWLRAEAIELHWKTLSRHHAKLLGSLQPGRVAEGGSPARYKLVAGPFGNAADAAKLCARLTVPGASCEGTMFVGSPVGDIAAR